MEQVEPKAFPVVLVACQASVAWVVVCLVAPRRAAEEEVEVLGQHLPSDKCDNTILIVTINLISPIIKQQRLHKSTYLFTLLIKI